MSVQTINAVQLEEMFAGAEPIRLINVLKHESFERVHIPGSESIPRRELPDRAPEELGREETIVVYCADETCEASPKAAATLDHMGYERVYDFAGGIAEWRQGGRPLVRDGARERAA
jgi:rhodanese-related sulfurtransferase